MFFFKLGDFFPGLETLPPGKEGTGGGDGEEHKGGVQLDARPTPVDGPTGKKKERLVEEMVKNIREEFSLMLNQLKWMDPQVRTRKG